jgi:hypothetical protein
MPSEIERERQALLSQLNNQGRLLERRFPADALELNAKLRKLVEWLAARTSQSPRGPKK